VLLIGEKNSTSSTDLVTRSKVSVNMKQTGILLVVLLFLGWGCQKHKQVKHSDTSHWSYTGEASPEHWAELSEEFIKCAEGHFQSPIDIHTYEAAKVLDKALMQFDYHPSTVEEINNGHTIQAKLEEENTISVKGHSYTLRQFHFHEPSEHHLDGIIYPMEMHLVHSDEEGRLAVVGVFIKEGVENPYLKDLWDVLPTHVEEHSRPTKPCDMSHLLPEEKAIYHYTGSLTTPPCTEGVEWYIMKEPISLSTSQIDRFRKLYHANNRPVQKHEQPHLDIISE
jgi:carbonic anhydrase